MILEVNEQGDVTLPAVLVKAAPHTRLKAERQGEALVLKPAVAAESKPRRSILHLDPIPTGPIDRTMTFRREDIYDDDGR